MLLSPARGYPACGGFFKGFNMQMTETTLKNDHATILNTFVLDNVEIRIGGKIFTALRESFDIDTKASLWGLDEGFKMVVSFDIGDSNIKVKSDKQIDIKVDGKWETKRIGVIDAHTGSFYKLMIEDKYTS
jgi:uncharacterized protein YxjI